MALPAPTCGDRSRRCFVGFFGLNRSLRWTHDSIKQNIFGPLAVSGINPVIAAHFNCPQTFHSSRSGEFNLPFNTAALEKLNLELSWLEPQSESNISAELPLVLRTPFKNEPDPDGTISSQRAAPAPQPKPVVASA